MLKATDLAENHRYVAKGTRFNRATFTYNKPIREVVRINHDDELVNYVEVKTLKNGAVKGKLRTISIKSFLRWAGRDIT